MGGWMGGSAEAIDSACRALQRRCLTHICTRMCVRMCVCVTVQRQQRACVTLQTCMRVRACVRVCDVRACVRACTCVCGGAEAFLHLFHTHITHTLHLSHTHITHTSLPSPPLPLHQSLCLYNGAYPDPSLSLSVSLCLPDCGTQLQESERPRAREELTLIARPNTSRCAEDFIAASEALSLSKSTCA